MIGVIGILVIGLLAVAAIQPRENELSDFELRRRCEKQDEQALLNWRRRDLVGDVIAWRRVFEVFLLVLIILLLTVRFDVIAAGLIGFGLALLYPLLAASALVRAMPQRLYDRSEMKVLDRLESIRGFTKFLKRHLPETRPDFVASSREELQHVIDRSSEVLEDDERKLLSSGFDFGGKLVKDHMTPRSRMEVIGAYELLGPVVLDDLHKTGHSHFPVLDGDIDHIIGILHLHNLLTLTKQESVIVKDVMEPKVLYIHEDQTLLEALSTCIKHRRHLLVVVNEFEETVGVITIEDAVEQLLGRKIVDPLDDHEVLQKVAQRKPRSSSKG